MLSAYAPRRGSRLSGKTREGISQVMDVHWRHGGGQCATVCPRRDIMFIVVTDVLKNPLTPQYFPLGTSIAVHTLFYGAEKSAVHFGAVVPFIGDASLEGAARYGRSKKEGAKRVRSPTQAGWGSALRTSLVLGEMREWPNRSGFPKKLLSGQPDRRFESYPLRQCAFRESPSQILPRFVI